jgi:hypothetical protein
MAYGTVSLDSITSSGNLSVVGDVLISGNISFNGINLNNNTAVVPQEQIYRLTANVIGQNASGVQNIFGVGVTLNSNTVYQFETVYSLFKLTGATSRIISLLFGGSATITNIGYMAMNALKADPPSVLAPESIQYIQTASATAVTAASVVALESFVAVVNGTVSINQGGTFYPQYSLSAAPGAQYNTLVGSYFKISAIGPANNFNSNVGYWA